MSILMRGYQAYLVRLWQSDTAEGPVWRASVESPHTGERRAFASLEHLFAFLEDETGRHSTPTRLGDEGENAQESFAAGRAPTPG